MHGMVEIHWYSSCCTVLARMKIKPSVVATIVYGSSFSSWVQVVATTCTNPSSGVTIAATSKPSTESGPVRMAT